MAFRFEPPLEAGWNALFHWDVGRNGGDSDQGTAMDMRIGANTDNSSHIEPNFSLLQRNDRENGFLGWARRIFPSSSFGRPIAEVRWCFFTANAVSGSSSRARLDGVAFGNTPSDAFSRPSHNNLIDRYCTALDLTTENCKLVSGLVFSRSGPGEHVWDPTHNGASAEGGSSSVLSPVVRSGDYSCMSLLLDSPHPAGKPVSFDWAAGRRAGYSGEGRRTHAFMRFYYFALGAGADHAPIGSDGQVASSKAFDIARIGASGFGDWEPQAPVVDFSETAGVVEFKWCYFGGNRVAGNGDRGRLDRLMIVAGLSPQTYANGMPERMETLERPEGSGLFSSTTQSRSIRDYCDGLNMSDYNCRRISRIHFFDRGLPTGVLSPWDNNHQSVLFGDSEPPYDQGWADPRMVASPGICSPGDSPGVCADRFGGFSSYSCMALVFDPPIPSGWDLEFRWTVGARHDADDNEEVRGTAVDVRFRADTGSNSDIQLNDGQGQFRQNMATDGFFPWQYKGIPGFGSPVPEIRWCFFSSNIRQSVRDLARIDGVLFGTTQTQAFCRPELNADDDACLPEHGNFIDRYCIALDFADEICVRVSRLVFSRTGIGEHVWDPTHDEASDWGRQFLGTVAAGQGR